METKYEKFEVAVEYSWNPKKVCLKCNQSRHVEQECKIEGKKAGKSMVDLGKAKGVQRGQDGRGFTWSREGGNGCIHGEKQLNGGARAADLDEGEIAPGPENKGRGLSLV